MSYCQYFLRCFYVFSERLKSLTKQREVTQTDLANAIGVVLKQIHRYELGQSEPAPQKLLAPADYFSVFLGCLCGRSDVPERRCQFV